MEFFYYLKKIISYNHTPVSRAVFRYGFHTLPGVHTRPSRTVSRHAPACLRPTMPKTRGGNYAFTGKVSLRNRFGESVTLYDDRLGAFVRCAHEAVARDPAEIADGKPFHVVSQRMFFHDLAGSAGLWHNQSVGPLDVPGFAQCLVDYATALEVRIRIGGERRILVTGGCGRTRAPSVILVWLHLFRGLPVASAASWLRLAWQCQRPIMASDASTTEGFPNLTRFANLFAHIDRNAGWVQSRVRAVTQAYCQASDAVLPASKSAAACAHDMAAVLAAKSFSFEQVTTTAGAADPHGTTLNFFDQSLNPTAFLPLLPEAARAQVADAVTSSSSLSSSSLSSFANSASSFPPTRAVHLSSDQTHLREQARLYFLTLDLETLRLAYFQVFNKYARGVGASHRSWFIDALTKASLGPAAANVASLLPSAPASPNKSTGLASSSRCPRPIRPLHGHPTTSYGCSGHRPQQPRTYCAKEEYTPQCFLPVHNQSGFPESLRPALF